MKKKEHPRTMLHRIHTPCVLLITFNKKMASTAQQPTSPFAAEQQQQRGVSFAPGTTEADGAKTNMSPNKSFKLVASPRCARTSCAGSAEEKTRG